MNSSKAVCPRAVSSAFAFILCFSTAPTVVLAQSTIMDEIVVTAQRRDEMLQDVPIAVTAYNDEQLEQLQVSETLDMTRLVPNFIGQNNTGLGTANVYSIRGLNNSESIATFDPPVGTYVDDVYIARQNANNFQLFDAERVEVLRGPQGTLFGRNTTGGAVRVILKKPSEQRGGFVEGGYGEFDRYTLRGTVDLPVSDRVLTKFSAFWIDSEGYVDNVTTGEKLNGQESYGVRGAVTFLVNDNLSWDLAMDYIEDDQANQVNIKDGSRRISFSGLSQNGTPLAGLLTGDKTNFAQGNEVESLSFYSTIDWDIDGLGTLSFITGWRDMTQQYALDFLNLATLPFPPFSPLPTGAFTIANDGDHEQFTQEVKLTGDFGDRVSYVAGVYYLDEDNTTDFGDLLFGGPIADRVLSNETEAWAVYLQGDYRLTDTWTLTLGARYTDEEKTVGFVDNQPAGDSTDLTSANMVAAGIPLKQSQDLVTPRLALQYAPTDDLNFYVSATRGFKSGGWNARGTSPDQLLDFSAEKVWSYEGGMRWDVSADMRLNMTAFYTDVTDFQLPAAFTGTSGEPVFITQNFADMEVKGFELELLSTPLDNLTLLAALGLQDSRYVNLDPSIIQQQADCVGGDTDACGVGIIDLTGKVAPPVRSPDYSLTIGGNYIWSLSADYNLVPSIYMYSLGNHNIQTSGTAAGGVDGIIDGYTTIFASLTLENTRQNWRVALECKNCNDRTMPVSILANQTYLQDPMTWNLRFRKDFEF